MKKNKTREEIVSISDDLTKSYARWNDIYQNGCQDPFWSDGCNLNLVRNHIIYFKSRIREIMENSKGLEIRLEISQAYWKAIPELIDDCYFAKPQSERAISILKNFDWDSEPAQKPEAMQLELFAPMVCDDGLNLLHY